MVYPIFISKVNASKDLLSIVTLKSGSIVSTPEMKG